MAEILFITTRNILNTSGELRLIKNRNNVLFDKWGIKTDFIVLSSQKKIQNNNEQIEKSNNIFKIAYNNYNPISIIVSFIKSIKEIKKQLKNNNYKIIILSGIGTFSFIPYIKKSNNEIPIITDVHGAKEELIEFPSKNLFKKLYQKILFSFTKITERKYLKKIDAALVVSESLGDYISKVYNLNNLKKYVVPCAIQEHELLEDIDVSKRKEYRDKYNIKENDILFIYSGGVSPWQCIEETVEIYLKIKDEIKINSKLLILSHNIETVKKNIKLDDGIIIDSAESKDVNNVLSAGDYAFLIRGNLVTNNVAYPNKFLEYVQSEMNIIATPNVYDIAKQIKQYNLGTIINLEDDYKEKLINYIISDKSTANKEALLNKVKFSSTLERFVVDFNLSSFNE